MGEETSRPTRSVSVGDGALVLIGVGAVLEEPPVRRRDAVAELDLVVPAEVVQAGDVEQLAGVPSGLVVSKASSAPGCTSSRTISARPGC
jgi:hypothetical protein